MDLFGRTDINKGVREFWITPDSVLLDVRLPVEYREGHIPGSVNLPLQDIGTALDLIENTDAPLFVYCYSGARSMRAAAALREMGFTSIRDLGGISAYTGDIE